MHLFPPSFFKIPIIAGLLFILPTLSSGQPVYSVGIRLPYQAIDFLPRKSDPPFSNTNEWNQWPEGYTAEFGVLFTSPIQTEIVTGIGIESAWNGIYPDMAVTTLFPDIGSMNYEVRISSFDFNSYDLVIPLQFAVRNSTTYEFTPFTVTPGIKLFAGLENRFLLSTRKPDVGLVSIDETNQWGVNNMRYVDKNLEKRVSDYYLDRLNRYSLLGNGGFALFLDFTSFGVEAGYFLSSMITSSNSYFVKSDIGLGMYYRLKINLVD